jgi:hypothetical protein
MSLSKNTKYILEVAMANAKAAKEVSEAIDSSASSADLAALQSQVDSLVSAFNALVLLLEADKADISSTDFAALEIE